MVESLRPEKPYRIGIIGDKSSLVPFWDLFASLGNERVLGQMGLEALALRDGVPPGEGFPPGLQLPVHPSWRAMLAKHPELSMVIETTGRKELLADLRMGLPPDVALVERAAASFFIRLLSSDQMWVACKLDLLNTQALLKTVIDQLKEEILLVNTAGLVLDCNKAVLDHLGLMKSQVTGQPARAFFRLPEQEAGPGGTNALGGHPLEQSLATGQATEGTLPHVDAEGRLHYTREYANPILDEQGRVASVLCIRRDITSRMQMEQRLQQSEKLASIGELSTYIAHEIRNPLFAIGGFANALLRDATDEKNREKLEIIVKESMRLDGILKNILTFARPSEPALGQSDINEVARQTMNIMGLACENQGIEAVLDLAPDLPLAKAAPELIQQCLINLVKNAVEAMPEGGRLTVRTSFSGAHVLLEVEDTGVGIPADIRDKVFSPFFSTKGKGSGLGLAMIRKTLDDMGGHAELASKPGEGTRVTLLLPPQLAVAKQGASG